MATMLKIPVTKAKGLATGDFIEVNTDDPKDGGDLPANVYQEALIQGLKVILNRGTTKITKTTYPVAEELKVAAFAKAQEQLIAMREGKIRIIGAKSDKASGKVMTEARRIAKNIIKDEMKRQGIKVSYVDAKDITAAANAYLSDNPEVVEMAKKAIEDQEAKASTVAASAVAGKLKDMIPINPKKKEKAEKEKADAKAQLSAMQAGKTRKREPAS